MQNATIVTDLPIYIDIRPWGSMATIIAHNFLVMNKVLEPTLAGLLMSAILSDTLNLQSPTSTDMDALMMGVLFKLAGVEDPNQYAKEQFKAKSAEIDAMSPHQLLVGDLKKFVCNGVQMGVGVVETTSPVTHTHTRARARALPYMHKNTHYIPCRNRSRQGSAISSQSSCT